MMFSLPIFAHLQVAQFAPGGTEIKITFRDVAENIFRELTRVRRSLLPISLVRDSSQRTEQVNYSSNKCGPGITARKASLPEWQRHR
jgi:hypothetical protein